MLHYLFYQKNSASHYVYIDLIISEINSETTTLSLAAWRPGRYELGNFSKNIKKVEVFNEKNEALPYTKTDKDTWQIANKNAKQLKVSYSYFCAELNAGACFADVSQIYINPVHCCMRVIGREHEQHKIELKIPDDYKIATSLSVERNTLTAANYEELVDSPFIASPNLQYINYQSHNITFHLHFNGICRPDEKLYKQHFESFTNKMIDFWGGAPMNDYHFLFQVLSQKFYHGVEHQKNTVIAIGPGYSINSGETYEDVLGVSCHELFHAWNIKYIRPYEMLPYNYAKENYARTGYVYEGFTTYYGDKLLLSSNVFTTQQYFNTLEERLTKHFHNYGRYNLSVAASSWETWLDGYVPGVPYRKTSIYDEGCLIAFMLDTMILKASSNKKSLRDVCVLLYENFGKKQIGYKEEDIIKIVNEVAGNNFAGFFEKYVYGTTDFEEALQPCFEYLGIDFLKTHNPHTSDHYYGFKVSDHNNAAKVTLVAPYSPAWKAGLFAGDEIIAINSIVLKNNLNNWLHYFLHNESVELLVNSNEHIKHIILEKDKKQNTYFFLPKLTLKNSDNKNFKEWLQF
ncbi:MAG: M61 family metallopeptidase [Bacteroidetes bacterium]|nr:M61 family metallopeptidase [Bacteroidota bacterium]